MKTLNFQKGIAIALTIVTVMILAVAIVMPSTLNLTAHAETQDLYYRFRFLRFSNVYLPTSCYSEEVTYDDLWMDDPSNRYGPYKLYKADLYVKDSSDVYHLVYSFNYYFYRSIYHPSGYASFDDFTQTDFTNDYLFNAGGLIVYNLYIDIYFSTIDPLVPYAADLSNWKVVMTDLFHVSGSSATTFATYDGGRNLFIQRNIDTNYAAGSFPSEKLSYTSAAFLSGSFDNYETGYSSGYAAGNLDGYASGTYDADHRVNLYSLSYINGYSSGYNSGVEFADGRVNKDSESYKAGSYDTSVNLSTATGSALGSIGDFIMTLLNIKVGGVSLWIIFAALGGVIVIGFVIKLFL